jgi:hypothetical protein
MFRLRAAEGLTLAPIGGRFDVSGARVRQLLKLHFGLDGVKAKVHQAPPIHPRRTPPPVPARARLGATLLPQAIDTGEDRQGNRKFPPPNAVCVRAV